MTSARNHKQSESDVDIRITNHGSIVLVEPLTKEARIWIKLKVAGETTFFGNALVVEPRYLDALVAGMEEDGLRVG